MISVVYIVGTGSRWNNNELRYSLRSIEKHLSGLEHVWIIGHKPEFITRVCHIPAGDPYDVSDKNILHKLKIACETKDITDDFLLFHDDHYLIQDFEAIEFPNYYEGTVSQMAHIRGSDSYGSRCRNTLEILKKSSLPEKYFDVHYPILINKAKFTEYVTDKVDPNSKNGYIIKSLYANAMKLEGTEIPDCKSGYTPTQKLPCFSTQARVSGAVYRFLDENFPIKSKYEL